MSDPDILGTTAALVRFTDGTSVPVTIHHHRNERGDYYVAHAPWPGLDYELHLSGNTARFAIERLVATGISNAASEAGCGLREVYMPGDVPLAEVTRLRAALDDLAHAHERDLMRLAVALGFDHEPPSDVDVMVAEVEALRTQRDFAANRLRAVVAIVSRGNDDATARSAAQRLHDLGHPDMASRLIAWRESEAEVEQLRAELDATRKERDAAILERMRAHTKAGLIEG